MLGTILLAVLATVVGAFVLCVLFLWIMIYALARRMFGRW